MGCAFAAPAMAFSWEDLWITKDQQAKTMMDHGQYKAASETFMRDDWRATAAYRAKNYQEAAQIYQSIHNEEASYNQGNAFAHLGKYAEAIKAYKQTLATNPHHQDALYNKKIVEDLLKKDQQKQDQQKQDQQKQDQQKQDQQKQDQQKQDQQKQDQQKQDQQKQDQQKQDQQKQDQQKQDQQKQDQQKQDQQKQDQLTPDKQEPQKEPPTENQAQLQNQHEKQQAKEQWLNLIPDDPGGLLREKFLRDHLRRQPMWNQ